MSSEPSTSPHPRWIYDVYLSFRGEDTRKSFISHLSSYLKKAGINVFKDDVMLQRGEEVSPSLLQAIQASRVSIIVFSKNYANSPWCLREVEKIMECRRTMAQVVIPVFYDVDPVEVRRQTGHFREAFQRHMERFSEDEVNAWRAALTDATNLSGFDLSSISSEIEAIENIVEHVIGRLPDKAKLFLPEHQYRPWTYDVYLSFRAEDTHETFSSNLHASLEDEGINVFKDHDALRGREKMSLSLLEAIRGSRVLVVIFSRNYADSILCLQELESIIECLKTKHQVIVPIFYDIGQENVRNQTGMFGEAFQNLLNRVSIAEGEVLRWRDALREAGRLSGFVVKESSYKYEAIEKVVKEITRSLDNTAKLHVADYMVGGTSRVQGALELLKKQQSKSVLLLGICGMAGIGKTTVAKAIYNQIGHNFECRSFLANIGEVWKEYNGRLSLQKRLLSDIFREKIKIRSIEEGRTILRTRFCSKKVLLVLDDTDNLEQMSALYGSHDSFGPGSCIIITTIDMHLVRAGGVDLVYRLDPLNASEAIELFSWHAFKQASPIYNFVELSRAAVAYSSGLPLALIVLGSHLFGRDITEWESVLERLKRVPNNEIMAVLRRSFDTLSDNEKEIFLDIACFFIGMDIGDVIQILNGCGFDAQFGISILLDKNLVIVDNKNKLRMHDLLRDMGREIIRQESPKNAGLRSRIWFPDDVLDVLRREEGTEAIEGLALKLPRTNPISLRKKAFEKMKNLRLLQLEGVQLDGDFKYLPRHLRWLKWHGFPLSHIPTNCYQAGSLVGIDLKYSNLKLLWKEGRLLNELKILNLGHSHYLKETPDFTYLPNLEKLILKDCPSLTSVSDTIGHLNELLLINLKDCTRLRKLPRTIYKLRSLKTFILSGCLMIEKLEEDLEQMESLTTLMADATGIRKVPYAVSRLKSIEYISLCGYEGLARDVIPSIMKPSSGMPYPVSTFVPKSSLRTDETLLASSSDDKAADKDLVSGSDENSGTYDVYLSFRDKDTHPTFSSRLHKSLENSGINVFKDHDALRGGEKMSLSLLEAIRGSRLFVMVFSRNYADSLLCLQELEYILESYKTKCQVVIPVFYDVDPGDVRNQTGIFGKAFQDLLNKISVEEDKVQRWRDALREAGGIPGFVGKGFRNIREYTTKVVESVTGSVRTNLIAADHQLGIQSRVQLFIQLLKKQQSDGVLLVGIWGMGGIGKTTFAKALFNQIGCQFEGCSFLLKIREAWQRERHASLQERILSDIFRTRERRIPDIKSGKTRLEERLRDKKVLLLLDDVNKREQLDALCGSRKWFGPGSIIIITTRDKRLLIDHRVDLVHTMKEMDKSESTELFSWHAFNQASPRQDFAELCGSVVSYCGGLPLALVVLGSELYRKEMIEWNRVLDGLKEAPNPVVQDVLRISYDDLNDDKERGLFLDISFFYIGINKEDVIHALKGYGDSVKDGITVLEDRSLVKVDENGKFGMHALLSEMGRKILRELFRIEPGPMIYDVFLSFRADTRASFTSHLYTYLENAGCHVFKDDESLQKGDQISISMMQAIGRSRISIVVLSEKYPNSRWCMIELEKILECRRTTNQQVLPVFYGVKPSEVLHSGVPSEKRSMFKEAFEELLGNISMDKDRELGWKRALSDISAIQGHPIANSWNESKDIKKVVADVTKMLNKKYLSVADHPVGVESRVADVIQLLDNHQEKDILVLGIWGMGGAGKTTIAKATYNEIGHKFEGRSFLLDVSKVWKETNGQVSLQKQLLSDVYEEMETKIDNIEEGKNILQERLRQKKILLVLDDVNDEEQLNALCGSHEWFKEGSRIIITTTIKKLVAAAGKGEEKLQARVRKVGSEIYTLKKMEKRESIELFSWHAFKQATPIETFHELSLDIVSYSGRLPLALEVLGLYFFGIGTELDDWKSTLGILKRIPHHKVQKKLRISFDGLSNEEEKNIFLDIAFFFIGMDRNDVIQILNGCRFSAKTGIRALVDRSLLTIDRDNKIGMHNLLRDMGREIVREKFPKEPEMRSRLWDSNDVLDVLQSKVRKGTRYIEGLALKSSKGEKIELSAFEMMDKLRLLQLDGVKPDGSFENMSRDLRWLYWRQFPSSHTPTEFDQGKLVAIELEHSNLKLMWEEAQMLDKLKILNLSHSHHLKKTPDFSYLPNLEKLFLEDCPELVYVSSTIGRLKKLLIINLKDCKTLRELPRGIYKLTSLQTLILSGCKKIKKLEEHLEQMKSLKTLEADETGIGQMPCALVRSTSIGKISWRDWKGISRDVFPSMIIWSWTSPTNHVSSRIRRSTGLWSCIVSLVVPNSSFQGLSSVVSELPKLRSLRLECSSQLQITGDVALDDLNATNWNEVEAMTPTPLVSNINASLNFLSIQMGMHSPITKILSESMFQKARTNWPGECLLPGDESPDWLTFNDEGDSVTFEVPQVNRRKLKSMMLCIAYSASTAIATSEGLNLERLSIRTQKTTLEYEGDRLTSLKDEDWQSVVSNLQANNQVWVVVIFGHGILVKKTMIYLIYDEPNDQNMEHRPADVIASGGDNIVSDGGEVATDMNENASSVDGMVAYENVTVSGGNMIANMNENVYGVGTMVEDENVSTSSVDDMVTNRSENTSNIGDMAAEENGIVYSTDDMATDTNESASSVEDITANLVSGEDKNRFGTFFKLRSLVHDIVKMWPFWFGLLVILVCITWRCFEKQEGLTSTSFQESQPTPNFKEVDASPTKQIEKWLDEEATGFKRKRTISSSSQSVVKHVPESQRVVEAAMASNTFKPKSKGLSPLVQTSPIAIPSDSLSASLETSGNEITAQNQEDQQLQETPLARNSKYSELNFTAEGAEKAHETNNVSPTSLDIPTDPTSTITTITPIMGAKNELDEYGDLLAELDKILSESYISSPTKVASAASEQEVNSLPVITVFNNIQELLDNQLEILVADGDIQKQLLECLAQLGRMKPQVPTNLQLLVTDIKKFFEEVVNNFPSVQEVLGNHQRLIDSKNRIEEEFEIAKAKQAHFSASISKGKERLNEMSKEITDLEEKSKVLSEKREKLQSTLKLSESANQNINKKVATLLKESKEVVSDLKESKSAFEEAESSKQNYDRKLVDLKQALGNIRP